MTAIPNPGYRFNGWSGISGDTSSVTVTLSDSISVTANFTEDNTALNTIVINEINYNSSAEFDPDDWVELYNAFDMPVDLTGWTFKDENDAISFIIPDGTNIPAGGYYVLARDAAKFSAVFPSVTNFTGDFGFGLNNAGEYIRLFDTRGEIVDSVIFDDEAPWPLEPDGSGPSLELNSPELDNSVATNWMPSSANGTPGIANDLVLGVDEHADSDFPSEFSLGQNFPNPFNPVTTIPFTVAEPGKVTVAVYSIMGQRMETVVDGTLPAGRHQAVFRAGHLPSGMYFYRIKAKGFRETKSMLLLK